MLCPEGYYFSVLFHHTMGTEEQLPPVHGALQSLRLPTSAAITFQNPVRRALVRGETVTCNKDYNRTLSQKLLQVTLK